MALEEREDSLRKTKEEEQLRTRQEGIEQEKLKQGYVKAQLFRDAKRLKQKYE